MQLLPKNQLPLIITGLMLVMSYSNNPFGFVCAQNGYTEGLCAYTEQRDPASGQTTS
jgi:hypothetical protein